MARTATGKLSINATATISNGINGVRSASSQVGDNSLFSKTFSNGVSASQFNRAWEVVDAELSDGASTTINLASFTGLDIGAGSAEDALGQAMDLEEVVMIAIINTTTPDEGAAGGPFLEIDGTGATGWSPIGKHTVANGGALAGGGILLKSNPGEAGFAILSGTSDRFVLTANGGDVTYTVLIFGRNDTDESSSTSSASSSSSSSSSISSSSVSSSISSSLSSSSSS